MDILQIVNDWAWCGWLVLIALFLVIEMFTLEFTFLMLSIGSLLGLASSWLSTPVWGQALIAALASLLLILFLRPSLLRRLRRGGDPAKSNVEALIGLHGSVIVSITPTSGQVKLSNGDIWSARTPVPFELPPATPVTVSSINGAIAVVIPWKVETTHGQ